MWHRQMLMDDGHHLFQCMRTGNGQYIRMRRFDHAFTGTQATRHDDLAILTQGFTDGIERFFHGRINKAAGVDHDQICTGIVTNDVITFRPQTGEDAFTINGGLGATQADHANLGRFNFLCHGRYFTNPIGLAFDFRLPTPAQ